jgi:methyl-accepting chemotaxis protein
MARLRTGLSALRAWRSRIDAGEVTVPELAGYYTGVVNTALELQSEVVNTMAASELERITRAALYVTRAKEAAGLERAMGATGLGAAEFPHDVFNRFIELGAVQLTTLNRAQDEIGDPDFTRVILSHPSHAAIEEQREIIRGAMTGLRQPILTAGSWFETSTAWIDHLRDVESGLKTTAIASAADDLRRSARQADADHRGLGHRHPVRDLPGRGGVRTRHLPRQTAHQGDVSLHRGGIRRLDPRHQRSRRGG